MLNSLCDIAINDAATPITMFLSIKEIVLGGMTLKVVSMMHFAVTRCIVRIRSGNPIIRALFLPLFRFDPYYSIASSCPAVLGACSVFLHPSTDLNQLIGFLFDCRLIMHFFTTYLSKTVLVALEVCIEYWSALKTYQAQIPRMVHSELAEIFAAEMKAEAAQVSCKQTAVPWHASIIYFVCTSDGLAALLLLTR